MLSEIFFPAQKRPVVMEAQVLHILHVKIIFAHKVNDLPQARHHAAGKNIFFCPGIAGVFFSGTDKMKEKYAALLQHLMNRMNEKRIIVPADMLHHADADHPVKDPAKFGKIPVIHQFYFQVVL